MRSEYQANLALAPKVEKPAAPGMIASAGSRATKQPRKTR